MISMITKFSMKNAAVIFIVILSLFAGGLYSYTQLNKEQFPNVDIPFMHVSIVYPGATTEQALNDIGIPVEKELSKIKGLKNLYDFSSTGMVDFTIEMNYDVNLDDAEKEVRESISRVKLPESAQMPTITK